MTFLTNKNLLTQLQHNSKLSHKIDVTPASSTISDGHVTSEPKNIKDNLNGERSDTGQNDQHKHDYKPNRENFKKR